MKMSLVYVFMYCVTLVKIFSSSKMMNILMSMELAMMSIYFFLLCNYKWLTISSMVTVVFLTFMVIESVMGLSSYISITRKTGEDKMSTNSFM
uniref:NADH dehydrogenase subunit 4L n=1 Tax=Eomenopon denticulatum TaxID=2965267 RepID=UPI0026E22749|nr:NADH dehydrogenase subunit 4L [Eomenopon denticulatum]WIM51543.1 NADH dehydrogenase subunit 4L [Eomenopon denticulatum]